MASILVTLTSSPETPAGQRALALVESLAGQGHALTLCCLQDAALLASTRVPGAACAVLARLLDRGTRCLALQDGLVLRGLAAARSASPVDHVGVVAALAAGHDRIIGAL